MVIPFDLMTNAACLDTLVGPQERTMAEHLPTALPRLPDAVELEPSSRRAEILTIAARRAAPEFVICDASMRILGASPDMWVGLRLRDALRSLKQRCLESRASNTILLEAYDDDTVIRIVPLTGTLVDSTAIFIEPSGRRGSVIAAAKAYGLTKREREVLQLVIRGTTSSEIAQSLNVAESTINDHIRSLMRKMNASKRIEIIGKVFNLEQELAAASFGEPR
jgi:DNA-binding NarL/FixJ family response regulator